MSESLFGDLDLENAPDDPNAIPDGTYRAFLTDVKKGPTKDNSKVGVTFKFKISEGDYDGSEVTEWKSANRDDDQKTKGYLKQRIISLGVPADRINVVDPGDLIGKDCYITVKNRNGYTNVNKVTLADAAGEASSSKGAFDI